MATRGPSSVCAMPRGNEGYIETLRATWNWLEAESRTVDDFFSWFANKENSWPGRTNTAQTRAFLISVGFMEKTGDGRLEAPPPGAFDSDESIIRRLHEERPFIGALLEEVAASAKTKPELQPAAVRAGLRQNNTNAVEYRLCWLRSAKMLEKPNGHYSLTERGRDFPVIAVEVKISSEDCTRNVLSLEPCSKRSLRPQRPNRSCNLRQ